MPETEYKFVDYLTEHIKRLATRYIEDAKPETLPIEFKGIEPSNLIYMITDHAAAILRKIEDDAITASIERAASLIRYAKNK